MNRSDVRDNKQLIESIRNNHQTLYLLSVEQLINLHEKITLDNARVVAGYRSVAMDLQVLTKMVRDLGINGRVYEKIIDGEKYVIFKGKLGFRSIFTATASNAKVVDMALGKADAIKSSIRSGVRLTIFLTVPVVVLQHIFKDEFILSQLVADLAVSIVKVGVSSIIAAAAATAFGTATTVALTPLAIAIFVGLAVGYSLDRLDGKYAITKNLGQLLSEMEDNTIGEFKRGLWELEKTLRWQITKGISPGKGIFYP